MNEAQRPIVYRIARAVQDEEISRKEALHQMQLQAGVPSGSAGILISVFDHMRRGVVYKRALSAPDTDYFFQRIQNDAGLEGLKSALDAFGLHIAYREGMVRFLIGTWRFSVVWRSVLPLFPPASTRSIKRSKNG